MIKCNSGVQMGSEEETHGNHGKPPAARFYCSITIGGLGSPDPTRTISFLKKEKVSSLILKVEMVSVSQTVIGSLETIANASKSAV